MSALRARGGLSALLLTLAGPLAGASPGSDPLDALMHKLAARRHGHVAFTEVQYLAVLDRPLESSGELLYDAPDRLEKRIVKPRAETLVLAHGVLSATRGQQTRTVDLAAWPQIAPLLEALRGTLCGDRAALERMFSVAFEGDAARWTLRLAPRDPDAARAVRALEIRGEGADLKTIEILEADGDRSLLSIGAELP